jgi:putative addiction module component (TIGR02574 family)
LDILEIEGGLCMSETIPNPPPGFDHLSVDEQIDYVQSLWDRIATSSEHVPVPEWHRRVIRERLEAYHANPTAGRLWEEVRTDIERKLGDR